MKKINLFVLAAVLALLVCSCTKKEEKCTTTAKDTTAKKESVKETEQKSGVLEGVWVSDDDKLSKIRIMGSEWTEIYDGETPEIYKFGIGDSCLANAEAKGNPKGKYITVFDPDGNRCFYVVKASETKLELSYVGRGNTLRYSKKEK